MAGEGMTALTQMYGNRKAQGQGSGFSKFLNVKKAFEDAKRIQEYKLQEQEAGAYNDRLRQTQADTAAGERNAASLASAEKIASVKQEITPQEIIDNATKQVTMQYGGEAGIRSRLEGGLDGYSASTFPQEFNAKVLERAIQLGLPSEYAQGMQPGPAAPAPVQEEPTPVGALNPLRVLPGYADYGMDKRRAYNVLRSKGMSPEEAKRRLRIK